jgi:two-component system CheB/CheR fusion protein
MICSISQGKIELRKEIVDLRTTCDAAIEAVRSSVVRRQHELTVDLPDEPVWVEGDVVRLQQIQVNLLVNACKYTPDSGKIRLRLSAHEGKAFITVSDTGVGLTREFQRRIFQPFVQSKRSIDRSDGGLGLGLALVRLLVEMHDGEVEVHSDGRDKGSEFTVWLPLTTKRIPANPLPPSEKPDIPRPLKVLVIDDNPDIRQMTQLLLESHGFLVGTASDGLSGLTAIELEKPDVALVDIGLPQLDGYEVARRARHRGSTVFLIAVTGYGREEDRRRAFEAGFDEHLTKPVKFESLWTILHQVAARRVLGT